MYIYFAEKLLNSMLVLYNVPHDVGHRVIMKVIKSKYAAMMS